MSHVSDRSSSKAGSRLGWKRKETREVKLPGALRLQCRNSSDAEYHMRWIHSEIFDEGAYDCGLKDLPDGAIVFDVGANLGLFSVFMAQRGTKDMTIHAFEPIPQLADMCKANVARYPPKNFKLHRVGLGEKPGAVDITYFPDFSHSSTIDRAENKRTGVAKDRVDATLRFMKRVKSFRARMDYLSLRLYPRPVAQAFINLGVKMQTRRRELIHIKVRTLSEVIDEEQVKRIDLLKVDTEGYDYKILLGIRDDHWPMIKRVTCDAECDHEAMLNLLKSKGYRIKTSESECTIYDNQYNIEAFRD